MSSAAFILVVIGALVALIFARFAVAFAIGMVGFGWLVVSGQPLSILASRTFGGMNEFVLLAIPFFLLAGELMNQGGITERIVRIANLTVGRLRGGLAQANVFGSMLFAGITGAAIADVAALGSVFIPSMSDSGYREDFSAAVTAASSIVGPVIPPSVILVVYGAVTNTSVGALFAAAIVPGVVLGGGMMTIMAVLARSRDLPRYEKRPDRSELPRLSMDAILAGTMPAIILFGILLGIFTPTEAAAVACVYGVLLGTVGFGVLNTQGIHDALESAVRRSAQLYVIIGFAGVLTWLFAIEGVPRMIAGAIETLGLGPLGFLLLISVILLFVGTWLETTAALIILGPTLADAAVNLGIHELHFGIVMVVALSFGLITPPLGICLFVASSVSNAEVWAIAKQVTPFFIADLVVLILLIAIPSLTLALPRAFGFI